MRNEIKIKLRSLLVALTLAGTVQAASILDEFPGLKKFRYQESESQLYLGFGVSPISILKNKIYFTANVFQLQWMQPRWDWELISASFGATMGKDEFSNSTNFTFRTIPKFRLTPVLSVGLVGGIEFVSFSGLNARFYKNGLFSPYEKFSSSGFLYGIAASETFKLGEDYLIKVNQLVYKQTYSVTQTKDGWTYLFENADIQANKAVIEPGMVFMLEFSLLY